MLSKGDPSMKRVLSLVVIALAGLVSVQALAQSPAAAPPSADQIIQKYIIALGGRAAIEKHTSRVSKGTIEIPDAGLSGTIEVSEKAPDKALTIIQLPGVGQVREGADASGAWQEEPQTGLRDKTGNELADARRGAAFNAELKFLTLYKTLAVTGQETVGGRPTWVLLATPAEGSATHMYFDAESGLMVRQSGTRDTAQGPIDVDVFIEDYRDVDGIKQPFTVRQVTSMFTLVVRMSEIKHNVALDDAIFKRPGAPTSDR
jgi:zinc protease